MSSGKYFDYTFDDSFDGKCKDLSWNRTEGVERQLCNLLDDSRNSPITYSQVNFLTGWANLTIRRWFAALLSAGVFTDEDTSRTQRWRLTRYFPEDRASLAELIPPVGSILVSGKQVYKQSTDQPEVSPPFEVVVKDVYELDVLPGFDGDDSDDFFSVFSRI